MDRDRNLLFGIFAVQLRKVTPAQLVEIAAAWAADPSRDLSARMADANLITRADATVLIALVDQAVEAHGGDSAATLDAFGGEAQTHEAFAGSIVCNGAGGVDLVEQDWEALRSTLAESDVVYRGVRECPGRYTMVRPHAQGGMGRVLYVTDNCLERDIALKELLPDPSSARNGGVGFSAPRMARFLQEARIAGQLEHPSIVPVYELGHRENGTPYYTMKLVRGKTLARAIKDAGSLRERLAHLPHFANLCQAIAYAHSRGVIHRDIKPENVMLGEFGETVVIDWGLAKAKGHSDIHLRRMEESIENLRGNGEAIINTRDGQVIGTPSFMPPEQAKGEIELIDERSDVYSLGAVLYTLLTGRPPFTGASLPDIKSKLINDTPAPLTELEPDVPRDLAAICERAMDKRQGARYQSARELVADVQRFQSGALVKTYDYSFREHLFRFMNRHRRILGAAAAVLLVFMGFAVYFEIQLLESRSHARKAQVQAEDAMLAKQRSWLQESKERERAQREYYHASVALAKKHVDEMRFGQALRLLDACPPQFRGIEWGLLQHLCNQGLVTIMAHSGPVRSIAMDHTGKCLITAGQDGAVRVWDMLTLQEADALPTWGAAVNSVAVSPDGNYLAFALDDGRAILQEQRPDSKPAALDGHVGSVNAVAFSSDGALLATGGSDATVRIWASGDPSEAVVLRGHLNDVTSVAFSPCGTFLASASRDDNVLVWDVESGECARTFEGHSNDVTAVAFSPDGRVLASASLDMTIRLWSVSTGEAVQRLKESSGVNAVAFSPDGRLLASATVSNITTVWDLSNGEVRRTAKGHNAAVASVVFDSGGGHFATGSQDGTVKLWGLEHESDYGELRVAAGGPMHVKFATSRDGRRLVAVNPCGEALVWDIEQDRLARQVDCGPVDAMELNTDGTRLLTLRSDGTVTIWDLDKGEPLTAVKEPLLFSSATVSPDGKKLALGLTDGRVRVFDVDSNRETATLRGLASPVTALAFRDGASLLASGCLDGDVCVWDLKSRDAIGRFKGARDVWAMAFSPDGARLAVAGASVGIWDWSAATIRHELAAGSGLTVAVAFSPGGERLATGEENGSIKLWDTATGREVMNMAESGGLRGISSVAFGRSGTALVAVGGVRRAEDTLIRWDVPGWRGEGPSSAVSVDEVAKGIDESKVSLWVGKREGRLPGAMLREQLSRMAGGPQDAGKMGVAVAAAQDVTLDPAQYDALVETAVDTLKRNRDMRGYRGRRFVSQGMYIGEDIDARPLQQMGLQADDVIMSLNGSPCTSYDAAIEVLSEARNAPRNLLRVELWRDGAPATLVFRPGKAVEGT